MGSAFHMLKIQWVSTPLLWLLRFGTPLLLSVNKNANNIFLDVLKLFYSFEVNSHTYPLSVWPWSFSCATPTSFPSSSAIKTLV